jgi:hypothetical protein
VADCPQLFPTAAAVRGELLDPRGNMAPRGARPMSSTTISRARRIACTALVTESSARWRRTRMPRSSRLNQRHFQTSFDGDLAEGLEEECFSGSARGTDHQIFRDLRSTPTCAMRSWWAPGPSARNAASSGVLARGMRWSGPSGGGPKCAGSWRGWPGAVRSQRAISRPPEPAECGFQLCSAATSSANELLPPLRRTQAAGERADNAVGNGRVRLQNAAE